MNSQSSISPLALSTVFLINSSLNLHGEEIVKKGLELGFSSFELNIEVTRGMIEEIKKDVAEKKIEIVSLHNFCPRLDFIPPGKDLLNAYQFSSPNREEREKAIELTKQTIDYAADLSAQAVVIHSGEVEIELNEGELFSQFVRGKIDRSYLGQVKKEREERKKVYLENSLRSVEEIVNYAEKKPARPGKVGGNHLKIGLENRFFYHEIPSFEEVEIFLEKFGGNHLGGNHLNGLGYWHDTGHAEIAAKLGFISNHEDYLQEYGSLAGQARMRGNHLIGIHLHDVKGFKDHLAPGSGEIDFSFLTKYMHSTVIKVVEAHRCSTAEEVKASINYLKKVGIT